MRDLVKEPLTVAELDRIIGRRDHTQFLRSKHEIFKKRNWAKKPPSRAEALRLMAKYPDLIKRPLAVGGGKVVAGYDEAGLKELV